MPAAMRLLARARRARAPERLLRGDTTGGGGGAGCDLSMRPSGPREMTIMW
jgi:hypothetical protein